LFRSGSVDDTAKNIINVPLMPLWRLPTSGMAQEKTQTRGRTKRAASDEADDDSDTAALPAAVATVAMVRKSA